MHFHWAAPISAVFGAYIFSEPPPTLPPHLLYWCYTLCLRGSTAARWSGRRRRRKIRRLNWEALTLTLICNVIYVSNRTETVFCNRASERIRICIIYKILPHTEMKPRGPKCLIPQGVILNRFLSHKAHTKCQKIGNFAYTHGELYCVCELSLMCCCTTRYSLLNHILFTNEFYSLVIYYALYGRAQESHVLYII